MLDPKPKLKSGSIQIRIIADLRRFPDTATRCLILLQDNWDDFSYRTTFAVHLYDDASTHYQVGHLRVGKAGMKQGSVEIETGPIQQLTENYFSLGMSEDYYDNLRSFPEDTRELIFTALRDMAYFEQIWARYKDEDVTRKSLLRGISEKTVEVQYKRIAGGGPRLTPYRFQYITPRLRDSLEPPELKFEVDPGSPLPPNNIHVIIGRNGVGKSHCLKNMFQALGNPNQHCDSEFGLFHYGEDTPFLTPFLSCETTSFVKAVAVSFSAFDDFGESPKDTSKIKFVKIGLDVDNLCQDKTEEQNSIAKLFSDSAQNCVAPSKAKLWHQTLQTLQSDPIFKDYSIGELATMNDRTETSSESRKNPDKFEKRCYELFQPLSSGHKIVLLTITSLVHHVAEKTLILIDEPETHLHPPLLAAFIRALSNLLDQQNGVAIVATHSPVVLQEVPRKCVWKLSRSREVLKANRPKIETFGENISVLTDDVFRLELEESGFHKLLKEAASIHSSYDEAVAAFDGQIGSEGRAILRGLYSKPNS